MLLVLWDIDNILLEVSDLNRDGYAAGFERVTGVPLADLAMTPSRTDRSVIVNTLRLHGLLPFDDVVERVAAAVAEDYAAQSELVEQRGRVLPGAAEALRKLDGMADVHQSVLTGCMRPIASAKLSALGLAEHLHLGSGAFGMDHVERWRLVPLACQRATEALGTTVTPEDTVVISHTPLDVRAARRAGARSVAVATGDDAAALLASGATTVLDDLTDTARLLAAVRGD